MMHNSRKDKRAEKTGVPPVLTERAPDENARTTRLLANLSILFSAGTVLMGVTGIIGMYTGIAVLTSIFPEFKPIAFSAAVAWIVLGTILAARAAQLIKGFTGISARALLAGMTVIFTLEFLLNLAGGHHFFEALSIQVADIIFQQPTTSISPVAAALIALSSLALFLELSAPGQPGEYQTNKNAAGILGTVIAVISFVFVLSYAFGSPLLYNTAILPIAFISSLAGLFFGTGLVTNAGERANPLSILSGPSTHARLLRTFLPLVIIALLIQNFFIFLLISVLKINNAVAFASSFIIYIVIAVYTVFMGANTVSATLNRADQQREEVVSYLRESEHKYRVLVENIPDKIFIKDTNLTYVSCNEHYANDLKTTPNAIKGKTDFDFYPHDLAEKYRADDRAVMDSGIIKTVEEKYIIAGNEFWGSTIKTPIRNEAGIVSGVLGIFRDITDRKRIHLELQKHQTHLEDLIKERTNELEKSRKAALSLMEDANLLRELTENALGDSKRLEKELQILLGEKETLLKEIHHRVKNNLQIIASLLNLQSQYVKDEQTLAVIRESQNRIKAMALIHEKIYQSESLDRIDYGDYLEKITRSLFESYGIGPKKIAMKIHAKNIVLHIDKAIPCSLIINELVSNSFKHAFPNDRTGEVRIDVKLEGDTVRLLYSDNGVGLPESVTLDRTESLGMRLIAGLTQQLKGTVEIQRGEGTTFVIAFKV